MVIGYVKRTASRKTEQSKFRLERQNLLEFSMEFQSATRKQKTWNLIFAGLY